MSLRIMLGITKMQMKEKYVIGFQTNQTRNFLLLIILQLPDLNLKPSLLWLMYNSRMIYPICIREQLQNLLCVSMVKNYKLCMLWLHLINIPLKIDVTPRHKGPWFPYKTDRNQLLHFSCLTETVEYALTYPE